MKVPAGFSGWWCARCEQACPTIPEDLDAAQTRCPHCHKWTAHWVPPQSTGPVAPASQRERTAEARALAAGPEHERQRPKDERGKELFDHIRHVIEHPGTEPDLRKIDAEDAQR